MHGGIANDCKVVIRYIDSRRSSGAGAEKLLRRRRRHPGRARLRRARHRGQDRGDPLRAREPACRSSASASACSSPSSSSRATCAAWPAPTRPRSIRRRRTRSSTLMPEQRERHRQGRHHAPRRYPCMLARAPSAAEAYGARRDHRAPPPPLRGQQRLPRGARAAGPASLGPVARRAARRDDRAAAITRTSSAASSTPSSSRGRWRRTRCSGASSRAHARATSGGADETAPQATRVPAADSSRSKLSSSKSRGQGLRHARVGPTVH